MIKYEDILTGKLAGQKFTNHALSALQRAKKIAQANQQEEIHNIHLLYSIFLEKGSLGATILRDLGVKKTTFSKKMHPASTTKSSNSTNILLSATTRKSLVKAYSIAKEMEYSYVGTEHLIYAIFSSKDKPIQEVIAQTNLSKRKVTREEANDKRDTDISKMPEGMEQLSIDHVFSEFPASPNNGELLLNNLSDMILGHPKKQKLAEKKPYLSKFCANVNTTVKTHKETIIGREAELSRVMNILGRKNKNNPLLIGAPGVGKTALIFRLAQLINDDQVPGFLTGKILMSLDITSLIAGTSFRGEFENRLKEIIKEVSADKNIILFIDELHNIIGAGNVAGSMDLANIIKPALSRGEIQVIGATTLNEYKKYIEKDAALERRFQPVVVKEPEIDEAKQILMGVKEDYESFHNVQISPEAIDLAVDLSSRYIQNRFLPDKAIDVIDESAANIRTRDRLPDHLREIKGKEKEWEELIREKERLVVEEQYEKAIELRQKEKKIEAALKELKTKQSQIEAKNRLRINPQDIVETVAALSHIPKEKLALTVNGKIKNIDTVLNTHIIGQEKAIEKITSVLIRSQFGLSNPDRPLGSFLFLGPTGVGKTETAKSLAREYFETKSSFIKIDMSEFMERHSVSALLGSPAGYVGYGDGGRLTEKVRRNPYAVVLFDEIEKAHPDVQNLLLQILEDGTLTDAEGTEVSFKNTIVILTSNIESQDLDELPKMGFMLSQTDPNDITEESISQTQDIQSATLRELERAMRPELLNRLDHIVIFENLGLKSLEQIARLELAKLKSRVEQSGLTIQVAPSVYRYLAKVSAKKNKGARLVRRNIQDLVEEPIAQLIMVNKVKKGKIKISAKKDSLTIS